MISVPQFGFGVFFFVAREIQFDFGYATEARAGALRRFNTLLGRALGRVGSPLPHRRFTTAATSPPLPHRRLVRRSLSGTQTRIVEIVSLFPFSRLRVDVRFEDVPDQLRIVFHHGRAKAFDIRHRFRGVFQFD